MNREELLNSITTIGTCEDEVERRTMLNTLRDEVSTLFDNVSTLNEQNTELINANENLRKANMDLFVQVGTSKAPTDTSDPDPEPEKRKFENLFNEKGELK